MCEQLFFFGGLLSAMAYLVCIPLNLATWLRQLLESISAFFFNSSFYLLLILWSSVLSRIQVKQSFSLLRGFTYFAMLVNVYTFVLAIIQQNTWENAQVNKAMGVGLYLIPIVELLAAVLFLFYGVRFFLRRLQYNVSKETSTALTKLTYLAAAGFITFIFTATLNFLFSEPNVMGIPAAIMTAFVFGGILATIRSIAILLILGIRLPRPTPSAIGSTSATTSGSWGGWSRGWKRVLYGSQISGQSTSFNANASR